MKLKSFGPYDQVNLLAVDARHTPFMDGAITTLTTNLGLPNIEVPGNLPAELRRILNAIFLAISNFYPEEDEANANMIRDAGLDLLPPPSVLLEGTRLRIGSDPYVRTSQ